MFPMLLPKGKLITSLLTNEITSLLQRHNIDPNNHVVHSGLLQINEIEPLLSSKEDKLILLNYQLDIETQLQAAEVNMFQTLEQLFIDNPILECHRMNFPDLRERSKKKLIEFRNNNIATIKQNIKNI
jgi:hypothetical protein